MVGWAAGRVTVTFYFVFFLRARGVSIGGIAPLVTSRRVVGIGPWGFPIRASLPIINPVLPRVLCPHSEAAYTLTCSGQPHQKYFSARRRGRTLQRQNQEAEENVVQSCQNRIHKVRKPKEKCFPRMLQKMLQCCKKLQDVANRIRS